ncbi:MAG TPA: universal stress protein, partial [Arenicellales bacterium]|nr:universal stress protein [Arenicellales bacterium]
MSTPFNPPDLQRMLVALDPFDSSDTFEGYVYRIAKWSHAEIVLLLVCELAEETLVLFRKQLLPPEQLDKEIRAKEKELEPRLMELAMRLRETGVQVFPRMAYGKRIGETILETAESEQVQLIVLGSRGHGA